MIKTGIQVDDAAYAKALARGLARESRAMMFFLLDGQSQGEPCDLILSFDGSDSPEVIGLTKDPAEENIYGDPPYRVFCYKDSRQLTKDLLFLYYRLSGRNMELPGDCRCRLVAFASAGGGCGCTSLAISVGRILNRMYGCKCLYLNLCPINDGRRFLRGQEASSLLTLLYHLDRDEDFPIGHFISSAEDIDYVNTGVLNTHFDEMDQRLLSRLMKKVGLLGEYDFLIADISSHLSRHNQSLLREADHVVLLRRGSYEETEPYTMELFDLLQKIISRPVLLQVDGISLGDNDGQVALVHEARRIAKQIMEEAPL